MDCAKKGTPSGGPRDSIPPIIVRSSPENFSTNFTGNEIEIRFDEYIKLTELTKELIISPPMKYAPTITPLSTSKTLKIKILDTLKPNTTYSFNFGKSIVDNNEGNPFEYFKYIFSTGSYIDSLKVSGKVSDAQLVTPEIPTTVMLYEVNESFKDSLIYSEKPTYITVTKDTTGTFELTNLKEGKYLMLAIKEKDKDYTFQPQSDKIGLEKDKDYTFQPQSDKIGFINEFITIPTDTTYSITLFKETPGYKLARPSHLGKNHILFGYSGRADSLEIEVLSDVPQEYASMVFRDEKKDTLHYWFKPSIKADSLIFKVANGKEIDTTTLRLRDLYADSLNVSAVKTGTLKLKDTFKLRANTPLVSFDMEKFQIMTKDSLFVEPSIKLNRKYNLAEIYFPKQEDQSYNVKLLPGALTDFFEKTNDTLFFNINTKQVSDYGTLSLTLINVESFPIMVQMLDSKYKLVAEEYLTENKNVYFDELPPEKYFLRIIYDNNKNGRWDTGSFLNRMQPERIIYYPSQIEVRANWSLNETFRLK